MAKRPSRNVNNTGGLALFSRLDSYVANVAQGRMQKGQFFSVCTRASFSKCYEFNLYAWDESKSAGAFFSIPTLRGICEELIVLSYAKHLPNRDRDLLFSKLMAHDVHTRLVTQKAFFSKTRQFQPILGPQFSSSEFAILEDEIRAIWRSHGWPHMNRGVLPPIRQIAEKQGGDVLAKLYDYLYRLTSGTVHFSVGALLRTGWGNPPKFAFSVQHLTDYYSAFARIYGAFMFCVYFELFPRLLRQGPMVKPKVDAIRDSILSEVRWPEMITFEEMNIPVPDPGIMVRALGAVLAREATTLLV